MKILPHSGLSLCFGNSFEMQLAFHLGSTSYMQWSNTLSNLALWSTRLWRAQPCLILWKCFSVCLHLCVSYKLITVQTGRRFKLLMHWFLLNWNHSPFSISLLSQYFLRKRRKKLLFLVRDARCHWLNLRAADHGCVDNTSLSVSFFTVKCTLDWQPLAPRRRNAWSEKYRLTMAGRLTSCIFFPWRGIHSSV